MLGMSWQKRLESLVWCMHRLKGPKQKENEKEKRLLLDTKIVQALLLVPIYVREFFFSTC